MTTPAPARPDNLLGICAALGEDFGFDPIWLRIALAAGVLWRPELVVVAYFALGVSVLMSRWLVPDRPAAAVAPSLPVADNDAPAELARAA